MTNHFDKFDKDIAKKVYPYPKSFNDILEESGLHKGIVSNRLAKLTEYGWISLDEESNKYQLTQFGQSMVIVFK